MWFYTGFAQNPFRSAARNKMVGIASSINTSCATSRFT